jgi:hypothetical protein
MNKCGHRQSLFAVLDAPQAAGLSAVRKLLLVYLKWRQGENGEAWPSLKTIEADLHIDQRTLRRAIDHLCVAECIQKTSGRCGRGHSNRYVILPDKKGQDAPISTETKGGNTPLSEHEKRGSTCQEKGAGRPLKEKKEIEYNVQRAHHPRTKAGKAKPKAKPTKRSVFTPPTAEEVSAYADSRGVPDFDGARFVNWYSDRGWMHKDGNPVLDWKGTVRTWIDNNNQRRVERGEPPQDGYAQYGTHPATKEDIEALQKAGVL